jgi:hypothetical protein
MYFLVDDDEIGSEDAEQPEADSPREAIEYRTSDNRPVGSLTCEQELARFHNLTRRPE